MSTSFKAISDPMQALWLGMIPYPVALSLQAELVEARKEGLIGDLLLLLTHPPTITLGRRARLEHLLAETSRLNELGIEVHNIGRGGDVTFHGPSQIIGYPIVDLSRMRPDIHWYLRTLEEALIEALTFWHIDARRFPPHTGVWINDRKVAAIGVQVKRWITCHGFALNVEHDLSGFELIVPCGIRDYGVTSITEATGSPVSVAQAASPVARALLRHLGSACRGLDDWSRLPETSRKILTQAIDPTRTPVLD